MLQIINAVSQTIPNSSSTRPGGLSIQHSFRSLLRLLSSASLIAAAAGVLSFSADFRSDLGSRAGSVSVPGDEENDRLENQAAAVEPVRLVVSRQELVSTLRSDYRGIVHVDSNAVIDLSGEYNLPLNDGVTLKSGGRRGMVDGALLFTNDLKGPPPKDGKTPQDYSLFVIRGGNVRVEGLRIRGPSSDTDEDNLSVAGIEIYVDGPRRIVIRNNVVIRNNEISGWPHAAIFVHGNRGASCPPNVEPGSCHMKPKDADDIVIVRNYLHDNMQHGFGYGVSVSSGAYAKIESNVFEMNRHAVASDGIPSTGYIARWNYILEGGRCVDTLLGCYWNQHFDVHGTDDGYGGTAGEYYFIAHNTIRGEQDYYVTKTRPALMVRGTPTIGAYFHSNVLVHNDKDAAVSLADRDPFDRPGNIFVGPNQYNLDTSSELAVGDFDGDGLDDVFLATGAAWFYSSGGKMEWRFLKADTRRLAELGFGRFDSDAKTDVFFSQANQWYFSSGGTGDPTPLRSSGIPFSEYGFGDFDGNGLTDVLRTDGTSWFVSWDARSGWENVKTSGHRVSDLRFGDFNGDGATDVFALVLGQWSWVPGIRGHWGSWQKLNDLLSSNLAGLAFGDFNGDGSTDIAMRSADAWSYSPSGQATWRTLRYDAGQPEYANVQQMLIGNFDGDRMDDALSFQRGGRQFVWWSRQRGDAFWVRSRFPMK